MTLCRAICCATPLVIAMVAVPAQAKIKVYWNSPLTLAERINPTGTSFTQELAKGYRTFALSEGYQMYDWTDADYFAKKALNANQGQVLAPEAPEDWKLAANHVPELQAAHDQLSSLLGEGAGDKFPALAATAQVKYDCWIEQQEENHQPADIAACKTAFQDAMAELKQAMQPPAPQAAVPTPKPEQKVVAGEEIARQVVYFDWDSAEVRSDAQAQIDRFVGEMRPMKHILLFVEGHADRSGSTEYNRRLSQRRAENVRAELVRQGMPVAKLDQVSIEAKGESEPAVATADGVREQANRRVEIVARGKVDKMVQAPAPVAPGKTSDSRR
jgi:OmpA-OmpF porin, OOP family